MRISDWSSDVCSSDLNGAGNIVTVHRPVKEAGVDNRLITVWFGATLTDPDAKAETRQFFVRDGGAFQREDGFLHFLEDFIGWDMPVVRKYDSPEGKLPLETVFPLFWVEQKTGWSAIPAAIPTYLRVDRKRTRSNSRHKSATRMPSSSRQKKI